MATNLCVMKTTFYDRHEKRDYYKAIEVMRQFEADPSMADAARQFVQQYMANDPHQAKYAVIWLDLLSCPVDHIAQRLLDDSPSGDLLRQTRPPFGRGLTSCEIAQVIEKMDA